MGRLQANDSRVQADPARHATSQPGPAVQPQTPQASAALPLRVSWVLCHVSGGRLGLCICPGQTYKNRHARDLSADLQHLTTQHGAHTLVCLLNDAELRSLGLRDYGDRVVRAGLQLVKFPIIEMAAPDSFSAASDIIDGIGQRVSSGETVVMHCRGGVGRAGMMAACVLLRLEEAATAAEAMKLIRWRRCPAAIETRRQEEFVARYEAHLRSRAAPDLSAAKDELEA